MRGCDVRIACCTAVAAVLAATVCGCPRDVLVKRPRIVAVPTQKYELDLQLGSASPCDAVAFTVLYDEQSLAVRDVIPRQGSRDSAYDWHAVRPGALRVAFSPVRPLRREDGALATVIFESRSSGTEPEAHVTYWCERDDAPNP